MPRHYNRIEITEANIKDLAIQEPGYALTVDRTAMGLPPRSLGKHIPNRSHGEEGRRRLLQLIRFFKKQGFPVSFSFQPVANGNGGPRTPLMIASNLVFLEPNGIYTNTGERLRRAEVIKNIQQRRASIATYEAAIAQDRKVLGNMARVRAELLPLTTFEHLLNDVRTWDMVMEVSLGGQLAAAAPTIDLGPREAGIRFMPVLFKNPRNAREWMIIPPTPFIIDAANGNIRADPEAAHPHVYHGSGELCWGQGQFNMNLHHNLGVAARWVIGFNEGSVAQGRWIENAHRWWLAHGKTFLERHPDAIILHGNPAANANAVREPLTAELIQRILDARGQWAQPIPDRALLEALASKRVRTFISLTARTCTMCGRPTRRSVRAGAITRYVCEHCLMQNGAPYTVANPATMNEQHNLIMVPPLAGAMCMWESSSMEDLSQGFPIPTVNLAGRAAAVSMRVTSQGGRLLREYALCREHWDAARIIYRDRIRWDTVNSYFLPDQIRRLHMARPTEEEISTYHAKAVTMQPTLTVPQRDAHGRFIRRPIVDDAVPATPNVTATVAAAVTARRVEVTEEDRRRAVEMGANVVLEHVPVYDVATDANGNRYLVERVEQDDTAVATAITTA